MTLILTFKNIDPEIIKANGWDILDIYSNGNLVERVPLSEVDSLSDELKVLVENDPGENVSARYSTTNPLASPLSGAKEILQVEEIKPETLSGSLNDIRKSLTGDKKSSKPPIP